MREKTYYEVLEEIECVRDKNKYEHFDVQLSLGATCAKLVEQVEKDKKLRSAHIAIPIRDQLYDITVYRLENEKR